MAVLPDFPILKSWLTFYAPVSIVVYFILWAIYARTIHPLANIPGPFCASISRIWLMWHAHIGDIDDAQRRFHKRLGPIIRIAPDEVVVDDPAYIPLIYKTAEPLQKTNWYAPWRPMGLKGRPDLFTEMNEEAHKEYRQIVGSVYSFTSIAGSESGMDVVLNLFMERLGSFADSKTNFDFGLWLEMYAFDNIGVVLFGQPFGFVKTGLDYRGYIGSVHLAMPFLTILTVTPTYLRAFLILVAVCFSSLRKAIRAIVDIEHSASRETESAMKRSREVTGNRPDLLSKLLAIVQNKGKKINYTENEIKSDMWVGIVFYFLMKNPEKLVKVRQEIDAAFDSGTLTSPVQYNRASSLPYLGAVIKETIRLFPAFSVSQPRYAPRQGIELCGTLIPAGYIVGLNPAIVQHNKGAFGADALEFRPERWLDDPIRARAMEKGILGWGAGTRTCVGRPLASIQLSKVVVEVLRRFTWEMPHEKVDVGAWLATWVV
ncbi:hypothetical protein FKW77_000763 [Venturia effusa]|uniref:Cytochrome P450 n=1 Tax=Venturia effusa TaxID=50376 RepID=A0A517L0Q9_9PEZI|nr:hypothetical protein FKW77_000763 [Venturia effusa]